MKYRLLIAKVLLCLILFIGCDSNIGKTEPEVEQLGDVQDIIVPEVEKKIISTISMGCFPFNEEGKRTELNLHDCSLQELRMGRNMLFAYYGYDFNDPELQKYFNQFSWYKPSIDFDPEKMSEEDKRNINKIQKQEKLLEQIPDKVIYFTPYTLYRPDTTDYTIVYACIDCKDATVYYDEPSLESRIAVIPGIKNSQEEILTAWRDAVFIIDTAGGGKNVNDDSIYSCMLKRELKNEPHICVSFTTEGWSKHTLFIGWKDGGVNRIADIQGEVFINDYTYNSNKQTNIYTTLWNFSYFKKQVYVYDQDKETIDFSRDVWPVFLDYECYAEKNTFYYDSADNAALGKNITENYFLKDESLNITLVNDTVFLVNSHSRPAIRGWVDFEGLPCHIPEAG